jgi:glutamate 5-kinase
MATRIAPHPRPTSSLGSDSRYARIWTTAAVATAGVWTVIAVLQSPRLPLFCLAAAVGAIGGTVFVKAPARSTKGRKQYVVGAAAVAGLVLVAVGMGHHITAGLTVLALLGASSPAVLRWLAGS